MSQYFAYDYTGTPFILFGIWHLVALLVILLVNFAMLGFRGSSDFLYINSKPVTASLLDALPRWPYYLIYMELLGMAIFLLLYLPFILRDARLRRKTASLPQESGD